VRFQQIGSNEFRHILTNSGAPPELIYLMQLLFTEVLDGRNVATTAGVQQVLGRPPRSFQDFARTTALSGVWVPQ